jgi:hypothetical protein
MRRVQAPGNRREAMRDAPRKLPTGSQFAATGHYPHHENRDFADER